MSRNNSQPMIDVRDLCFQFDADEAAILNGIDFQVHRGDVTLILGPSGSGKSTLTFCLNGLYPEAVDGVQTGRIVVKGRPVEEYAPGKLSQHVGVVFQDPESQFCMVKVEDELAFGLENIRVPAAEIDRRIDEALDLVGLRSYRDASIHELSGGMKQKLALACVLALQPDICILDEPTANLDPVSARDFVQLVRQLHKERKMTLLVIEHRLDEWMSFVTKALVLDDAGTVMFDGETQDCFDDRMNELHKHGIWTPSAAKLGLKWRAKGLYGAAALPLTEDELAAGVTNPGEALQELELSLRPSGEEETGEGTAAPVLSIDDVTYARRRKGILKNVSLELYPGEIIAVVGPNGAGKTTFAHLMAGLLTPTGGEITLHGKPLHAWQETALRQEIGLVFQNPEHQFITDTVFDEVAFSLRMQGVSSGRVDESVQEVLQLCKLSHLKYENPFSLSQGQKRRLSVATMIVDKQRVLILDEPTFGQDAYSSEQLMTLIANRAQEGTTVVIVTHDMELVRQYADRVVVLADGTVQLLGTPASLWGQPFELFHQARLLPPVHVSLYHRLNARKEEAYVVSGN